LLRLASDEPVEQKADPDQALRERRLFKILAGRLDGTQYLALDRNKLVESLLTAPSE
jgi:hypothetical protein